MNRLKLAVASVVMMLAAVAVPLGGVALADEAVQTQFLPTSPVLITAYWSSDGGQQIKYIEFYNTGKTIINLMDWDITDFTIGNDGRKLLIEPQYSGQFLPGTHVVASLNDSIANSSFKITGWSTDVASPQPIAILRLENPQYRSIDANLPASGRDKKMVRTYNTDSYSTAANPFVENNRVVVVDDIRLEDPVFDDGLYAPPEKLGDLQIIEIYPYSSSCSPFDTDVLCGDYIKLANTGTSDIELDDLMLRTDSSSANRAASNTFSLAGTLQPGETYLVNKTDAGATISLTNSGGYVWLEDKWGLIKYAESVVMYPSAGSAQQGLAYAQIGTGPDWQWTSEPRPYGDNVIVTPVAELASCAEGKYRNPETNRCRNIEEVIGDLVPCQEGYERNPTTNRCRKVTSSESTLTPCKEGYERNPATNRCRSIASAIAELIPCNEGYERNPATNRCRKVQGDILGAEYPVEPYKQEGAAMATWWVVGALAALAAGYGLWEWRREIGGFAAKLFRRK